MAEKKNPSEEKIYTVPLRKEWLKTTRVKRAMRAVSTIRSFLSKHTHSDNIKLSAEINDVIWKRGAKKPPSKIKIRVKMNADGTVEANLPEIPKPKEEPSVDKPEKSKTKAGASKPEKIKKNNKTVSKK